jgi:hypothetical protein
MDPHDELAAHYAISRGENPDADLEEIVALVDERMSVDGEIALASESLVVGGDVDGVRQYVYDIELEGELEDE